MDRRRHRGHVSVRPPPLVDRAGRRASRRLRRSGRHRARPEGARDDRPRARDVERFHFNTPIAAVMELLNELTKDTAAPDARVAAETAVSLIQPYAPHHWRGAVGATREGAPLGAAVARAGPAAARARHVRAGRPGRRPRTRPPGSGRRAGGGRTRRARAPVGEGERPERKQVRNTIVVPRKLVNLVIG